MADITARFFCLIQNSGETSFKHAASNAQASLHGFAESCKISLGTHQVELLIALLVLLQQI